MSPLPCSAQETEPTPVTVVDPVTIAPPDPPGAPDSVTVSGITDTSAFVSWSPVPEAETYTVWVDGNRFTGTTGTGTEIKGLEPYTEYAVHVTAANASGESPPSPVVNFRTLPPEPGAPDQLQVVSVTENSAVVRWHPLPSWQHIQFYRIYVDGEPVADVDPLEGLQMANLTNLQAGDHTVAVSGINENCEGPLSQAVSFTVQTVAAPSGLAVTNRSADSIWIMWDPVIGADRYVVLLNGQVAGETRERTFHLKGLDPETQYEIGVKAAFSDGNVSSPATLEAKTLSAPEQLGLAELTGVGSDYFPDVFPGMVVVFAIGGAFVIARLGQYSFRHFRLFR